MKAVIVSGGTAPSLSLLNRELTGNYNIICADSGGECLYKYGITPSYLIGDFDSIDSDVLDFFLSSAKCIIERYPKDKDFTDTELSLNRALSLGADEIVFLGCTGSRLDHILGNIGLLKTCLKHHIRAVIKDEHNEIFLTDKSTDITGDKGTYFSVQSFGPTIENLSITGGKFDLIDYKLSPGDPLTISNEFMDNSVHIQFNKGLLLIMYCRD